MTLASAATPLYFYPFEKRGNFYISGDNIASSPSLFAIQHAIDRKKKKLSEIRLVNIGSINELPDTIETEASLLDWIKRLFTLQRQSKLHTMKYQARKFAQLSDHLFYDFTWQVSS